MAVPITEEHVTQVINQTQAIVQALCNENSTELLIEFQELLILLPSLFATLLAGGGGDYRRQSLHYLGLGRLGLRGFPG